MKIVKYKEFQLSKFALGTVQLGLDYGVANATGQPKLQESESIISYAQDSGINCFDTASAYGESEEILGFSLHKKYPLHVITKLASNEFIQDAKQYIDKSLKKLKIDTLFGLLLHDSRCLISWDDTYKTYIEKLIELKKIHYFGVSIYTDNDFELALENKLVNLIQVPFNIFDNRAITKGWLEKAKKSDKIIFIRSIYLQGLLLMDIDKLPANLQKAKPYLEILDNYCKKLSLSRQELALSYINSLTQDEIILFGCETLSQIKENIHIFNNLYTLDKRELEEIYNSFENISQDIYNPTRW